MASGNERLMAAALSSYVDIHRAAPDLTHGDLCISASESAVGMLIVDDTLASDLEARPTIEELSQQLERVVPEERRQQFLTQYGQRVR